MKKPKTFLVPQETIENKILFLGGKKVMLDRDLATLYGVETRALNQAVRRNMRRFPEDFMFQLTKEEMESWKSQIVISNREKMGLRRRPYAFTEQGVAMLSSVLNSDRAIQVNIQIIGKFFGLVCLQYLQEYLPPVMPGKFKERTGNKSCAIIAVKTPTNLIQTSRERV
jgi:hypothetical protein